MTHWEGLGEDDRDSDTSSIQEGTALDMGVREEVEVWGDERTEWLFSNLESTWWYGVGAPLDGLSDIVCVDVSLRLDLPVMMEETHGVIGRLLYDVL